ncbi:MAG: hypothetical protein JOZ46_03635 [Candidatus Dormibacteraeota bacterium]|nr:hypothetical protein [Candidatus Dormibacteraeota bacterium]MBV9524893.1 hypothetical protein [Candidatus Dormibacteraeota bacterium]
MASTRKGRRGGPRKGALKKQRAAPAPRRRSAAPRPLDDYALGETLRLGLAGPVRAAVYRPTGGEVAVEEIPGHLRTQSVFVSKLAAAGLAASTLRHPRVAAVYEVVSGRKELHVIAELVRGPRLSEVAELSPMPVLDSLFEALAAVHAHGMAHGSVSPECLVLQQDGGIRLIELGLSEAVCAAGGRECTVAGDLVAAAAIGLGLLGAQPTRMRRSAGHRRAVRALRHVVASEGAHATLSSAAAIRAALPPRQVGREPAAVSRRLPRRLRRAALALAPVAVGIAAGLTVATAMGSQPPAPPLTLVATPRLVSYPASGRCGATFVFTATGPVRGAGTLTYQWLRSDGAAGPVRHLTLARNDESFRVTSEWTLESRVSGPITMTLRVTSPAHLSLSRSITAACT